MRAKTSADSINVRAIGFEQGAAGCENTHRAADLLASTGTGKRSEQHMQTKIPGAEGARPAVSNLPRVSLRPCPATELPFVSGDPLRVGACWDAEPTGDYSADIGRGAELAQHYLAFIRDGGSGLPGGLMQVVSSMAARGALDRREAGDSCPVALGFLAEIDAALRSSVGRRKAA